MESTGYSKEDILRARNRHPYWKRKKMEGSAERTRKRLAEHDYSGGESVQWDAALVSEFLSLNRKASDGRYEHKDWQLAERFGSTIPSIQYMRRKLSKVEGLLGSRASQGKLVEYLLRAESVLARGKDAVEGIKAAPQGRKQKPAAKKPASSKGKKPALVKKAVAKKTASSAKKTAKAPKVKAAKNAAPAKAKARPKAGKKK
jgi:hypothetical protein